MRSYGLLAALSGGLEFGASAPSILRRGLRHWPLGSIRGGAPGGHDLPFVPNKDGNLTMDTCKGPWKRTDFQSNGYYEEISWNPACKARDCSRSMSSRRWQVSMQPGLCPLQQLQASAGCSRAPPEGKAGVRGKGNEAGALHHPPRQDFTASAGKPQVLGEGMWSWQVPCPSCPRRPLLLFPLSTLGLLCIPRDDGGQGGLTRKTQCPVDEGTEGSSQNACGGSLRAGLFCPIPNPP